MKINVINNKVTLEGVLANYGQEIKDQITNSTWKILNGAQKDEEWNTILDPKNSIKLLNYIEQGIDISVFEKLFRDLFNEEDLEIYEELSGFYVLYGDNVKKSSEEERTIRGKNWTSLVFQPEQTIQEFIKEYKIFERAESEVLKEFIQRLEKWERFVSAYMQILEDKWILKNNDLISRKVSKIHFGWEKSSKLTKKDKEFFDKKIEIIFAKNEIRKKLLDLL